MKIERKHLEICERIAKDMNRESKIPLAKKPDRIEKYEEDLFLRNLTLEQKKKLLLKNLFLLIASTFAIDIRNIKSLKSKSLVYEKIKSRLGLLRNTVSKLRDINYYLKTIYISELNADKIKAGKRKSGNKPVQVSLPLFEESGHLTKDDIDKLEQTVYLFILKSEFLDQKILEGYKAKKFEVVEQETVEIKDLEDIIARQSELLCYLEAKIPPAAKFKATLLNKRIFAEWVSRIFALLVAIHFEVEKEEVIFARLKKSQKTRRILNKRINSLVNEKFALMKLKEQRLLSYSEIKNIEDEHHVVLHHYTSSLKL